MAKKEENKTVIENSEVLAEKLGGAEAWIEDNPKVLIAVVAVLILAAGGFFGYRWWIDKQDFVAQQEMFQAVRYFEADSLDLAMKGTANVSGFETIIDEYGMTPAGNLANYYAGVICLKQGKFPLAIFYLKDFKVKDLLVQARAYSLLGDAYMEQNDFGNAADAYHKASAYNPNKYFTPSYLMKEALAYEKLTQNDKAIAAYDRIIKEFWESQEVTTAKKLKARLESAS
ncbi:MAG TPA: tetratricopeptide repeat protein [Cyclobacteriaceae bacterium]|nr:tetratricopeptide repeat protein [Cyclobacteriaceae bacterium]